MNELITAAITGIGSFLLTGCDHSQNDTLPVATNLPGDVQLFPGGPEYKLENDESAMEQYRASRAELLSDAPSSLP